MIWLQVEDIEYYTDNMVENFKKEYNKIKVIKFPNEKDIKENLNIDTLFMAPYDVPSDFKYFIPQIKINSKFGALTTQEYNLGLSNAYALEKRLGINIVESTLTMNNIGGADELKKWTKDFVKASTKGYKAKAFMFAGVPGTGKTFFAKCFAGETNRKLVFLNLSDLLTRSEPIVELDKIHTYLNYFKEDKFVILLDEVEKMIGNQSAQEKQILGAFLTLMNEMHTPTSKYDLDVIYLTTANNLKHILINNPEFLRRGRFDELFFLNIPSYEYAEDIFKLYAKSYKLEYIFDIVELETIMGIIHDKYNEDNTQPKRFIYTPAEIETFFKLLDFKIKADYKINEKIVEEVVEAVIPIVKSAKEGINEMLGQRELFREI